jgi:tRNA1Val (adenine37-N6)-methyltransferase
MPNSYFQFKQFTIHQDQCAMKVCTDACIFGAWFAGKELRAKKMLDIGSGTGLLMLMLAQQNAATISGIEIDPSSFQQLKENIESSKWKERLAVCEGDVRSFEPGSMYDFIISNPPFYENSLEAESEEKNLARHSKQLTLEELIVAIDRLLSADGSLGILLPYYRVPYFESLAAKLNFHLAEILLLRQSPSHDFFRGILYFSRHQFPSISKKELIILDEAGQYTMEFVNLLKDYYLYL